MKSKTKRIETSRLRRDYIFSRVVTIFGLLILATFATLLLHILINAFPLLSNPEIKLKTANNNHLFITDDSHAVTYRLIQDDWFGLYSGQCAMHLSMISRYDESSEESASNKNRSFALDCSKKLLGLIEEKYLYAVQITQSNVIELHQLDEKKGFELFASFALPIQVKDLEHSNWQLDIQGDYFVMQHSADDKKTLLQYSIGSLQPPKILTFSNLDTLHTLSNYQQYIGLTKTKILVFDENAKVLQSINVEAEVLHSFVSSSQLDLFLIQHPPSSSSNNNYQAKMMTMVNEDGKFLLKERFQSDIKLLVDQTSEISKQIFAKLDAQQNALFIITQAGQFILLNAITGEIQASDMLETNIQSVSFSASELLIAYRDQFLIAKLENMQGIISLHTLFGKNHYTAYVAPEYIWQTSVSNEFQSPKYSIVPLVMGSLKASLLALIVALPLALGAAIFTAYFASQKIRNIIKPSIEMLEAIPSVIIGFIAAVWLAPFAQQYLISLFSVLLLSPLIVIFIAAVHGIIQAKFADSIMVKWQFAINLILLIVAIMFIAILSSFVSAWFIGQGGNALVDSISSVSLSKTAIVVSLALGVAIAPTIYTLIDDALFEVPDGVKQASFALGATKIQTLVRVVLVVAFPSIISAVMLGFGRAFGETMIVLMVTGNTPIANWDLLSGLRTLTSNLAIELQEAQVDSTLYHVLFLTAAILFMFTFLVNTIAAMLKRKVRNS